MNVQPLLKFDLNVRSAVVRAEKPAKPLEAIAAANQHQMNRIKGFLADGTAVVVAQRPGRGGMDFNKILGGKVYAVAADGLSPVFEKGEDNKPTKVQKTEDGLPLFSSSGFYLLSSKEYPALEAHEAYTLLLEEGELLAMVTPAQLEARKTANLTSELDWDLLAMDIEAALGDEHNLVSKFDAAVNRKRQRAIENAKAEAEDNGETFSGAAFAELAVSKKDGNAMVAFSWKSASGAAGEGVLLRQAFIEDPDRDDGKFIMQYWTPPEAVQHFLQTPAGKQLFAELEQGHEVRFGFAQGHLMRTSVSFRKKMDNFRALDTAKPLFGDNVYISATLEGWTKGLVAVMFSQHPGFPGKDYDSHHYVAAPRQAEVGMNKKPEGTGWQPPKAVPYAVYKALLA